MKAATMDCLADSGVTMLTVCAVKPTGSPGAATACTSTLTQKAPFVLVSPGQTVAGGVTAFHAAAAGAWLHGQAAQFAPARGMVASDIPDHLPTVLRDLAATGDRG